MAWTWLKPNPKKHREWRRKRANRDQRGSTYFGDIKAQLKRVNDQCNAVNAAAAAAATTVGGHAVHAIDTSRALRACVKRVEKFYGLRNKALTKPGYRK